MVKVKVFFKTSPDASKHELRKLDKSSGSEWTFPKLPSVGEFVSHISKDPLTGKGEEEWYSVVQVARFPGSRGADGTMVLLSKEHHLFDT